MRTATRKAGLGRHGGEVCARTVSAFRAGEPAILLRDAERPRTPAGCCALSSGRHPTLLFGDGGTGKSYFALAAPWTSTPAHRSRACRRRTCSGLRSLTSRWTPGSTRAGLGRFIT